MVRSEKLSEFFYNRVFTNPKPPSNPRTKNLLLQSTVLMHHVDTKEGDDGRYLL